MSKLKNKLLGMMYAVLLGMITGIIIWAFLKVMNLGISFLWDYLPSQLQLPFYTIAVCLVGSLLIGLYRFRFGDYPEELTAVLGKLKKDGRYPYHNLFVISGAALFPLLLGASVGPEAGLTGVIVGLCCWIGDKLKRYYKEASDLAAIGASASLATIFRSPMFGFVEPIEGEADIKLPKASKTVLYILATLSSFGIFILLNRLTGSRAGFASISFDGIAPLQYLWALALTLVGVVMGLLFLAFEKIAHLLLGLVKNVIIRCAIGGLALGAIGTLLPLTMFSGEHQIEEILDGGAAMGVATLLLIAVAKLFLTAVCIASGLKGGHFFPVIFAGIAAGFAFSAIIGLDAGFCMAAVTAALLGSIMKKPVAVTLLLLILFPWQLAPVMLGTAALGSFINIPRFFHEKPESVKE